MLSESEQQLLGSKLSKPSLDESLNLATKTSPDLVAESLDMPISADTYNANKSEIDRQKKLFDINPARLKETHPKTAEWLTDTKNASLAIDDLDILKGMEDISTAHDRTWGEFGVDTAVDLGKGIVGLGESVVGLLDIVTVNTFGDAAEILGYDAKKTKDFLSKFYSEERKEADVKVARAKGFFGTLEALAEEPETALGTIVESAPMMLGAAAAVKKVASEMLLNAGITAGTPAATKLLTSAESIRKLTLASSVSEGAMVAGQIQESARGEGRKWSQSVVPSVVAGTVTAIIGKASSKLLPDAEVSLVIAAMGKGAKVELLTAGKEIAKTTFKEGILEELPQSAQEQVFTNLALGKNWADGVSEASAMGLVAGAGTGAGMSSSTQVISLLNGVERGANVAIKSNSDQKELDQVVSYAQTSKTNGRAKTNFEDFVNTLGEDREVLIPNDIAEQMVDAPEYVTDKLNDLGISISIPLNKFAGEIAVNDEWMALIRPHIKLSSNMMSQEELADGNRGEIQALLKRAQDNQETITESERIYETVKDQIIGTKTQGESTARHAAQLYPARAAAFVEKARNAGHDLSIKEAFEMMGFEVKAGEIDVEVAEGVILDQPAYQDAPVLFDAARDRFLDVLPEDAVFDDVLDSINEFSSEYKRFIKALDRDDWLGFDYPAQAIEAVLSEDLENYDISPNLKRSIGRMVNAEIEGRGVFSQQAIPDDMEITMETEVIETGEKIAETFNAKELNTEINDKLDAYKRLRDCLA